jgi:hypothetical protein
MCVSFMDIVAWAIGAESIVYFCTGPSKTNVNEDTSDGNILTAEHKRDCTGRSRELFTQSSRSPVTHIKHIVDLERPQASGLSQANR